MNSDWVLVFVGFVVSVLGTLLGTLLYLGWKKRRESRPLNQILNFSKSDIIFVLPHRDQPEGSILPRTSTEDFLAVNNFISALLKIGWKGKISVRDPSRLSRQDRTKNLVLICSAKSNLTTAEVDAILLDCSIRFFRAEQIPGTDRWQMTDGIGNYPSAAYDQLAAIPAPEREQRAVAEFSFDDVATITKVDNPWNAMNKLFVVAGVRGIGTWGAAECIKKAWDEIYDRLPRKRKSQSFSALIRVRYDNCDLKWPEVHSVVTIEETPRAK